ncbi:MAG: 4-hydroxy-tetrahydrodipicolinate synthase [Actinomycetes bacterium]
MPVFGRVVTAMATPFDADGALDAAGAARLARHLVEHGTDTVLLHGTTGESPTLRGDEIWRLLDAVRAEVGDDARVMLGTGSNDTAHAIDLTARAAAAGADSVLVVTPYYNRPTQRALVSHFRAVAEATELPVLLYDVPARTATEISLETLVALSSVQNVVGVKDAAGDLAKTAEVVAATAGAPGGFEVYCGADELNLPMLAVGAVGFVSVASHLAGPELAELARLFESDPVKARELHLRLLPLCRALFLESSPAPLKAALAAQGLPAGPVRAPLADALDTTRDAVLAALDHLRGAA